MQSWFEACLKHHWRFARHVSCTIQQMGQTRFGMAASRSSRSRSASKLLGLTVGGVCANNGVGRVDGPHTACKQLRGTSCCFPRVCTARCPGSWRQVGVALSCECYNFSCPFDWLPASICDPKGRPVGLQVSLTHLPQWHVFAPFFFRPFRPARRIPVPPDKPSA